MRMERNIFKPGKLGTKKFTQISQIEELLCVKIIHIHKTSRHIISQTKTAELYDNRKTGLEQNKNP